MEVFNQAVPIYLDEQTRMIRYLAWEHVGTCLDWDDHTQICLMANCAAVPFYDILAEDALGYDLECPPLIVLDCHPQQLGTSLTFITWLAQGCARTHTQDWFWDLKLFPKGVLLEVRIEVEKVETAEKVEKVESTDFKNCVNGNTAQHWTGTEINSSSSNCFGAGTHGWSIRASWDSCKELRWAELCKSPLPPCSELYAALLASQQTIVGTVPCAKGSHTHTHAHCLYGFLINLTNIAEFLTWSVNPLILLHRHFHHSQPASTAVVGVCIRKVLTVETTEIGDCYQPYSTHDSK